MEDEITEAEARCLYDRQKGVAVLENGKFAPEWSALDIATREKWRALANETKLRCSVGSVPNDWGRVA